MKVTRERYNKNRPADFHQMTVLFETNVNCENPSFVHTVIYTDNSNSLKSMTKESFLKDYSFDEFVSSSLAQEQPIFIAHEDLVPGTLYKHEKGEIYILLGVADAASANPVAVYRSETKVFYSRPVAEFKNKFKHHAFIHAFSA